MKKNPTMEEIVEVMGNFHDDEVDEKGNPLPDVRDDWLDAWKELGKRLRRDTRDEEAK